MRADLSHCAPHLLQVPMEDGTYGVTLPPKLFGEDDTDGAGGEEGFQGWGGGQGQPGALSSQ